MFHNLLYSTFRYMYSWYDYHVFSGIIIIHINFFYNCYIHDLAKSCCLAIFRYFIDQRFHFFFLCVCKFFIKLIFTTNMFFLLLWPLLLLYNTSQIVNQPIIHVPVSVVNRTVLVHVCLASHTYIQLYLNLYQIEML